MGAARHGHERLRSLGLGTEGACCAGEAGGIRCGRIARVHEQPDGSWYIGGTTGKVLMVFSCKNKAIKHCCATFVLLGWAASRK